MTRAQKAHPPSDFDLLFQNNPLPMWIFDLETLAFLAVNDAAVEQYGYSRAEFLSMTLREIRPAEDIPALEARIVRQTEKLQRLGEWRHKAKSGKILWVEISVHGLMWQGHKASLAVMRDVSEPAQRREEIHQLWQKHVQLEEIVNQSRSVAFIWRNEPGYPVEFVSDNIVLFGYTPEEFTRPGFLYNSILHPGDVERVYQETERALAARQKEIYLEYRLLTRSGETCWVEDHSTVNYNWKNNGPAISFSGVVTDITKRVLAEQALSESLERYRQLLEQALEAEKKLRYQAALAENVSDAVISTDMEMRVTNLNRAAEEMYGWQGAEVIGQSWTVLVQSNCFSKNEPEILQELLQNGFWSGICSQSRKNGERFFVEIHLTLIRDQNDQPVATVAVNRDITERLQNEQRLRASEERFRLIFNQAAAGVARVSLDGRFVEINQRFCALLGYDREEMFGKTFQDITYPADLDRDLDQVRRLLKGEIESYLLEKRYITKVDEVIWVELSTQLVRDINHQPEYFVSVVQDITPRKAREAELATIYQSGVEFDMLRSPAEIARKLIGILSSRLDWHHAGVWMRRGESDELEQLAFSQSGARDSRTAAQRSKTFIRHVGDGMTGWVIANGQSARVVNLEADPRFLNVLPGMKSGLYVPIKMGEKTVGCISAESEREDAFDEHAQRLLETLASQAAAAIVNASLLEAARAHAGQMETLVQTGRALSSTLDAQQLLPLILSSALQAIPSAQKGSVLLLDESGELLAVGVAQGYEDTISLKVGLPKGKGYAWQVIESGAAMLVEDISQIPSKDFFRDIPEAWALQSSIAAPLVANGRAIGVLCLDNATRRAAFSHDDLQLLEAFAASAAISLENARLFEQTRRRAEELTVLMGISVVLRSANSQDEIVASILSQIQQLFNLQNVAYVEPDEKNGDYVIAHGLGAWTEMVGSHIPAQNSLTMQVHNSATYYYCPDTRVNVVMARPELLAPVHNLLGMPLIVQSQVIASLWLGVGREQHMRDFSQDDIRLLHSIADIAANAINRISLYQKTAQNARHMAAISALARSLGENTSLKEMYRQLALAVYDLLPDIAGVIISRFDARRQTITCVCVHMDGEFSDPASLPTLPYAPKKGGRQSRVIATRQTLIVKDVAEWKPPAPNSSLSFIGDISKTTRSALYVPMIANDKVVGLIQAQSYTPNRFSAADAGLLSLTANTGAVELQNMLLLEEERHRAEQLARINEMGHALAGTLQENEIHQRLAQVALELLPGSSSVYLSQYDPETQMIRAVYGLQDGLPIVVDDLPLMPLAPAGGGTQSEAVRTARAFLVGDLQAVFRKHQTKVVKAGTSGPDTRSGLYVPLLLHEQVIGVLQVQSYQKNYYTEADAEMLGLIANAAAVAVENARLYAQALQRDEQLSRLNVLGRELAATLDLTEIYHVAYRHVCGLMDAANFAIDIFDAEEQHLLNQFLVVDGQETNSTLLPPLKYDPAQASDGRARAIFSAAPVLISDLAAKIRPEQVVAHVGDEHQPDSALYAPMVVEGRVFGLLEVQSYQHNAYGEMHSQLLSAIGNQVGMSIQRTRLFAQTQRRVEQLSALRAIDNAINSSVDINVTLNILLEYVRAQLKVDAVDILLVDQALGVLTLAQGAGFYDEDNITQRASIRLGEGLAGRAALERRTLVFPDIRQTSQSLAGARLAASEQFISYAGVPLVAKGELEGLLEIFQRSRLSPDDDWVNFLEMLAGQAAIALDNAQLFQGMQRSNQEITLAYDATIEGWSHALELRDEDTEGHSARVTNLALELARALGVRAENFGHMRRGGLLHDIGKIGIPDAILHKPGPLTPEEWDKMREHPALAYKLLSGVRYLAPALEIPYCHHEKWDGSGYPRGLKGDKIPLAARIFAIADVFDALTSDRVYRKALSREEALEYIREQAGEHFDPRAVEVFLRLMKEKTE